MRTKDVLLIIIIIAVGLSIQGIVKLRQSAFPFLMDFGGKENSFLDEKSIPFAKGGAIEIDNAHGDVNLIPWEKDELKVELEKVIRTDDEKRAREISDQIVLKIERRDDRVSISTNRDALLLESINTQTNMKIFAPEEISASIRISHGDLALSGLTGNFTIDSQHGATSLKEISGNLTLVSSHGDINAEELHGGTVEAKAEHAEAAFQGIDGNLNLTADHENATITDARKDVRIISKESELTVRKVGGNLTIDSEHSEIYAEDIKGNALIKGNYKDIEVSTVAGVLEIAGEHCDVVARNAASNASITNDYGSVTLFIPEKANFSVDCTVDSGDIESDFNQLAPVQEKLQSRMTGQVGQGGPRYVVKTRYNDIILSKMSAD